MSYLQDQAMAAAGYKKSGKDQEAALDKALKSADYLASRGADGIAALKDLCKQKKVGGTTLPKGWQQKIPLQGACMNSHMNTSLKFLVEEIKVDLDAPEPLSGDLPIHTAVAWGRPGGRGLSTGQGRECQRLRCRRIDPLQAAKRRQAPSSSPRRQVRQPLRGAGHGHGVSARGRARRSSALLQGRGRRERPLREPLAQGQAAVLLEPVRMARSQGCSRRATRAFA